MYNKRESTPTMACNCNKYDSMMGLGILPGDDVFNAATAANVPYSPSFPTPMQLPPQATTSDSQGGGIPMWALIGGGLVLGYMLLK